MKNSENNADVNLPVLQLKEACAMKYPPVWQCRFMLMDKFNNLI